MNDKYTFEIVDKQGENESDADWKVRSAKILADLESKPNTITNADLKKKLDHHKCRWCGDEHIDILPAQMLVGPEEPEWSYSIECLECGEMYTFTDFINVPHDELAHMAGYFEYSSLVAEHEVNMLLNNPKVYKKLRAEMKQKTKERVAKKNVKKRKLKRVKR